MENETMLQGFEWYLADDGQHWQRLAKEAPELARKGIKKIWLPPAYKATKRDDVGYGVYDLFDLGEFDQKGTIRTKYGSKADYLALIHILKECGIDPIADVVLNHKAGADQKEEFQVVAVDPRDRTKPVSDPFLIQGWTHFCFLGRRKVYNDFQWHWYHFTGTDYDAKTGKSGIYQIQGDNKGWAHTGLVDSENGNYDYLMFADIDFKHPEVIQNLYDWASWFIQTTGIKGFRLDAIKHIDAFFMNNFIRDIKDQFGPDFYVFGEYWSGELEDNEQYLKQIHYRFDLIDTRLHLNLFDAGRLGSAYDLRGLLEDSLVKHHPKHAVTFVENHDTQKGQALESTVADWFKAAAYAFILLRKEGLPCVFYGDYYGVTGKNGQQSFKDRLDLLLDLRLHQAYGDQTDYFDNPHCIGWTRKGKEGNTPLAVLINNHVSTTKRMYVGPEHAGREFCDALQHCKDTVQIDEEGWGEFLVPERSVSVWKLHEK
ncbi:alpha-amylase [Streptococcus sp. DD13]|uniref:alpha-amylase n=1 Tax=Streptococcus sp. DD13 TaxID=1777881 RepID=UPI000792F559|nr:alpha-amylase [Streptococcus sp. DD13]KXT78815.1 Cytoplasmic alpha-amylase [Streptococcus sp. DD13]